MAMRSSAAYMGMMTGLVVILAGLFLQSSREVQASKPLFERKTALVRQLELTDLCLFTEAGYTRHQSMADLSTPFQDAPLSFEHFPTGGLVEPPLHLVKPHVQRD